MDHRYICSVDFSDTLPKRWPILKQPPSEEGAYVCGMIVCVLCLSLCHRCGWSFIHPFLLSFYTFR